MRKFAAEVAAGVVAALLGGWFLAKVGVKANSKANADVRSSYAQESAARSLARIAAVLEYDAGLRRRVKVEKVPKQGDPDERLDREVECVLRGVSGRGGELRSEECRF